MALTEKNHHLIRAHFAGRDTSTLIAVDATCGNGHDTLFLAQLGFKKVYAFDIQQQAIKNTKQRVQREGHDNVYLVEAGHEKMVDKIYNEVDCILFNLGYLPGGDKTITTLKNTSLIALKQSLKLITPNGLISVLCYPGHPQGKIETNAIQTWLSSIDEQISISVCHSSHPNPAAPLLLHISLKDSIY